jgi:transposase-like protein
LAPFLDLSAADVVLSQALVKAKYALANINLLLILAGFATMIDICQVKYLNNIVERDPRFIKKITKPMMQAMVERNSQYKLGSVRNTCNQ